MRYLLRFLEKSGIKENGKQNHTYRKCQRFNKFMVSYTNYPTEMLRKKGHYRCRIGKGIKK